MTFANAEYAGKLQQSRKELLLIEKAKSSPLQNRRELQSAGKT
jgi:hypothetical protein